MTGIIYFIGILVIILILVIAFEYVPYVFTFKKKSIASALNEVEENSDETMTGIRKRLHPLEGPVAKYTKPKMLKKTKFDLYWGQMAGKFVGWTPVQLITYRIFIAVVAGAAALILFKGNMILFVAAAFVGWKYPVMGLSGAARKTRRQFQGQLPEFIQLIASQMSAGVSFEEAVRRTSRAESLPALWMRKVLQMAQGRNLVEQIQREAVESQLSELISTGMQLSYLNRGAAQQKLLDDLAQQMSSTYTASVNLRAEKIGSELVIPMVLFYFLPFLVSLMAIIAYPVITGLF